MRLADPRTASIAMTPSKSPATLADLRPIMAAGRDRLRRAIPPRILLHWVALRNRIGGEAELRLVPQLCDRRRVSIDVGASMGTYALAMRPRSRAVILLEPDPTSAHWLRRAFGSSVDIREIAASDSDGTAVLRIPREPAQIPAAPSQLDPAPPPPPPATHTTAVYHPRHSSSVHKPTFAPEHSSAPSHAAEQAPAPSSSTVSSGIPGGAFGQCVVARESGGNPQVMNSSGHYGLYQFSASTWAEYGGNPADFGHASVAEQNQVFANALARGGEFNWSPYDGC